MKLQDTKKHEKQSSAVILNTNAHHKLILNCVSLTARFWWPRCVECTGQFLWKLSKDDWDFIVCTSGFLWKWEARYPFTEPFRRKTLLWTPPLLPVREPRQERVNSLSSTEKNSSETSPWLRHRGHKAAADLASLVLVQRHTTGFTDNADRSMVTICWITLGSSTDTQHTAPGPFRCTPSKPGAEYRDSILLQGFLITLVTVAPNWLKIFNDIACVTTWWWREV